MQKNLIGSDNSIPKRQEIKLFIHLKMFSVKYSRRWLKYILPQKIGIE